MPPIRSLEERIGIRLAGLRSAGLERFLSPPSGVDLASNDYLGLSRHPSLIEGFVRVGMDEGCGSTGSRLLRGERDVFQRIERRFAAFKGAERSLYFSSGYLANLGVLSALTEAGDIVFSDQANHASLIDGLRLSKAKTVVFPHNDVAVLRTLLAEHPLRADQLMFIVTESVFSMDGDMAPLADYANLCRAMGALLIVDEAHAVGVYGDRGSGLLEAAGVDHAECVSINTAGKALGAAGAWVAGPAWAVEYLVQRARTFVFSTAPLPAVAGALEASLDIVEREPGRRHRVRHLSSFLRNRLRALGVNVMASGSQIVPILIGDNERAVAVARAVQTAGFDVRAIRPPSVPVGTARLRVSVNAGLDEEVLGRFAQTVAVALQEAGVCFVASS